MTEPVTKDQLLQLAKRALDEGRIDRAVQEYQRVLAMDARDQRVRLRLAELFVRLKQIPQAVQTYSEVAQAYVDDGFYLKAVTVYKNLLKIDPARHEANLALAELYEKMGLQQEAIHQYQILLRHAEQKGQHAEALDLRRRIVGLDPENITQRMRLAEAYQLRGEESASVHEYEVLAEQLRDSDDQDRLIDLYEKILSRRPDHLDCLRRLCRILVARSEWRKLLQCLTAQPAMVGQDAALLKLLAEVHARLNQNESARTKWRELAELLAGQGTVDEAMAAYEEFLILAPDAEDEITEAVEQLQPGGLIALRERANQRRAAATAEETTASDAESAPTAATQAVAEREAQARQSAARYVRRAASTPEEWEALLQRAQASGQLSAAYREMGLMDEAREEEGKARQWYQELLTSPLAAQARDGLAALEGTETVPSAPTHVVSPKSAMAEPTSPVVTEPSVEPPADAPKPSTKNRMSFM